MTQYILYTLYVQAKLSYCDDSLGCGAELSVLIVFILDRHEGMGSVVVIPTQCPFRLELGREIAVKGAFFICSRLARFVSVTSR